MKSLLQFMLAAGLAAGLAQQPEQPLRPAAGYQKLHLWTGEWTYEGEIYATSLGPGGKFKGTMSGRITLDGFGLESVFVERGPAGETRTIEMDSYDPVADHYPYLSIDNTGNIFQGHFKVDGTVARWEGTALIGGKRFHHRGVDAVSADGASITKRGEISADGKTWTPQFSMRAKKVSAAPAK